MAQSRMLKTSFTAGELAPELLGRPDLRAMRMARGACATSSSSRLAASPVAPACAMSRPCLAPPS